MPTQWQVEHFRGAIELASEMLKSLILVNGGAAIGLLTFYGNFIKSSDGPMFDRLSLVYAMSGFGVGLVLSVFASGFGSLSSLSAAMNNRGEVPLRVTAVILALLSAIAFATGVYFGATAIPGR